MNTTSLLLQAVDNLEQQRDTPGRGSSSSSNVLESNPRRSSSVSNSGTPNRYSNQLGTSSNQPGSSTRPGNQSGSSSTRPGDQSGSSSTRPGNQSGSSSNRPGSISNAAQLEFNRLFSWNPKSSVGSKRKKGSNQKGGGSKKKRLPTWTHTFVCLANTDDDTAPGSKYRASLQLAGLGEKRLSVDLYADTRELHDDILFNFPKLIDAGGYELLRSSTAGPGKELEIIPQPGDGYTVEYLKAVVHQAKVFIQPLQQNLELSSDRVDQQVSCSHSGT